MDYKKEFEEALKHMESLMGAISWVGGDSYEVECVNNMTEDAYNFFEKHSPPPPQDPGFPEVDRKLGKYHLRSNLDKHVFAFNKRHAKNLLGVSIKEIICTKPPQMA